MGKTLFSKRRKRNNNRRDCKRAKSYKRRYCSCHESVAPVESIEKNIFGDEENKLSLIDKISTGKNEEEIITNKIVIKELINKLDKKEKEVIMLRFYKEKTQSQVAKILGITQVQVSRIERRILNSMKLKLTS
ncbi:MAG: sigma-70 family RNA polymerase sigma factor [Clostridia bacterium]